MPDEQMQIFISYSRENSNFVDRLDADLQARGFKVWVDRRRLEGGQQWQQEIHAAVARCNLFLLIISPAAVDSMAVRQEFDEAVGLSKRVLPILFEYCVIPSWLASIANIHNLDFSMDDLYHLNLKRLLYAILDPELDLSGSTDALYNRALRLRSIDPERAVIILQHIVDRDPSYFGGQPQKDLIALETQLYPSRIARLQVQAENARQQGQYGVETASLQAIIKLGKQNTDAFNSATEYLPIARQNRALMGPYAVIQERVSEGDLTTARAMLLNLWTQAPYFGDPAKLATRLDLHAPHTYDQDKAVTDERKRFDLACSQLQSDLSSETVVSLREKLQIQGYDIADPQSVHLVTQMVESWKENAILQKHVDTKNAQSGCSVPGWVIIVTAVLIPLICGDFGSAHASVLPFGGSVVIPIVIGVLIDVGILCVIFCLLLVLGLIAYFRPDPTLGKAKRLRESAKNDFERWRELANIVLQQRIDEIYK